MSRIINMHGELRLKIMKKLFLRLELDNHLNWKNHIDQMIPVLCGSCYVDHVMWIVLCGSCCVDRVMWIMLCGSCYVDRVMWIVLCG
jgi:hypothetical protein